MSNRLGTITERALRKMRRIVYKQHESLWCIKNLSSTIESADKLSSNQELDLTVHFDRQSDIIAWLKRNQSAYPWIYSEKEINVFLQFGHMIPFIECNSEIIAYAKVARNRIYIKDYDTFFDLAPNKAMFYDTTVIEHYRGKKVPHTLKQAIFSKLESIGIEHIYSHMELWNIPAIKSNTRLGFIEIGTNRYVRILGYESHSLNIKELLGKT